MSEPNGFISMNHLISKEQNAEYIEQINKNKKPKYFAYLEREKEKAAQSESCYNCQGGGCPVCGGSGQLVEAKTKPVCVLKKCANSKYCQNGCTMDNDEDLNLSISNRYA